MSLWSQAKNEYVRILKIDPENSTALNGRKETERAINPEYRFISQYIHEKDSGGWTADTFTCGFQNTGIEYDH